MTQPSLTSRDITAIALTVTGATTHNKQYDGNNAALVDGGSLVGVLAGEVANVALHQSGTFGQINIGTGIAITSTCTIDGTASGNYTLTQPSLTSRDIISVQLTAHITADDKCYDGGVTATLSAQWVTGMVNGETDVTLTVGAKSFDDPNPGSRTVTASILSLGGTKASNYVLALGATATTSATIKALPVAGDITGLHDVIMSNTITLTSHASSGSGFTYSWNSSSVGIATVDLAGATSVVHPASIGTTNVTYTVTDGTTHCSNTSANFAVNVTGKISGYVTYDNSPYFTPLNGVQVTLNDGNGHIFTTTTAPNFSDMSGNSGYYEFTNGLTSGSYTLSATTSTIPWGGNNSTDALIALKRAVGLNYYNDLRDAAADVNSSGTISALDALYIKLRTVGTITSYPAGNWKFESPVVTLTAGSVVNLKGICVGDLNGSYIPTAAKSVETVPTILDNTIQIEKGISFNYDIKSEAISNLGAMTLVLNYDESLFEIESINSTFSDLKYQVNNGEVLVAWADMVGKSLSNDDVLLSLQLKAKQNLSSATDVFSVLNSSEFADVDANVIDNVRLKLSNVITANTGGFAVTAYPNPFKNSTNIAYTLPENSSVKITLSNMLGQSVATLSNETKAAGFYNVVINANELNLIDGIYFYTIEVKGTSSSYVRTNKLVLEK